MALEYSFEPGFDAVFVPQYAAAGFAPDKWTDCTGWPVRAISRPQFRLGVTFIPEDSGKVRPGSLQLTSDTSSTLGVIVSRRVDRRSSRAYKVSKQHKIR